MSVRSVGTLLNEVALCCELRDPNYSSSYFEGLMITMTSYMDGS